MSFLNIQQKDNTTPLTPAEFNYLVEKLNNRQLKDLIDVQLGDAKNKDFIRHNGSGWVFYDIEKDHYTKEQINNLFGVDDIGTIPELKVSWGAIEGDIRNQTDLVDNFGDLKADINTWEGKHYAKNYVMTGSEPSESSEGYMDFFYASDGNNSAEIGNKATLKITGDGVTFDFVNREFKISGGAVAFTGLTDTPNTYSGFGERFFRVNQGESGVEYFDINKTFVDSLNINAKTLEGKNASDFYPADNPEGFLVDDDLSNYCTIPYGDSRYQLKNSSRWVGIHDGEDDCWLQIGDENPVAFGHTFGSQLTDYGDKVLNNMLFSVGGLNAKYGLSVNGVNISLDTHTHDGVYAKSTFIGSANIDDYTGDGIFEYDPVPTGTAPTGSVPNWRVLSMGRSSRQTQMAFPYNSDKAYFRRKFGTSWGTWREFWHTGNLVGGTGATNFAFGNHTHSYLPLSGGTITGDLTTSKSVKFTGTGVGSGIVFNSTTIASDSFGIRSMGTNNAGEMEFWTSDDDTEPFVFRHYTTGNDGSGSSVEWFRIYEGGRFSSKGNAIIGGDVYANGSYYYGDYKAIIRFNDDWLRLNPSNQFARGIYCNTGIFRTDGELQVGNSGDRFVVKTSGNVGIGTTSPLHSLDFAKYLATEDVRFINFPPVNYTDSTTYGSGIIWKANYDTYTKRSAGIISVSQGDYFRQGLAFMTNGTASSTADWSEKMRITGRGNVGIGTTSPSQKLEVNGNMRLTNTYNGNWNTGDELAKIEFYSNDASGEGPGVKAFISANTSDTYGHASVLRFGTTSNGSGSTTRVTINQIGNVGIGTTSPSDKLDVNGTIRTRGASDLHATFFVHGTGNYTGIRAVSTTATRMPLKLEQSNSITTYIPLEVDSSGIVKVYTTNSATSKTTGALVVSGGIGVGYDGHFGGDVVAYASSDRRLKDNIKVIEKPLEMLFKISGNTFTWNDNQETYKGKDYGVIAQEVQEVMPELVDERDNGYLAVKYEKMIPLLIESIKELKRELDELKNK